MPKPNFNATDAEALTQLTSEELDSKPFGVIKLDPEGKILFYSSGESQLTGRAKEDVVGKNFFSEVAPCTDVQEFAGKYREGVAKRDLHTVFPYVFDYKMEPRQVWVTLYWSDQSESGWVMVNQRQEG